MRRLDEVGESSGTIHFHPHARLELSGDRWDADDAGQAEFTSDDGRMGEEAAAFDEEASSCRKQDHPARVSLASDEDFARFEASASRVENHSYFAANDAWTGP